MAQLLDPEREEVVQRVAETQKATINKKKGQEPVPETDDTEEGRGEIYMYYTKHEHHELERVVGTAHVGRYVSTESNVKLT